MRSPPCLVPLSVESLGELEPTTVDDSAVDQDVHAIGFEVVEQARCSA